MTPRVVASGRAGGDAAAILLDGLRRRGLTLAVAESLTGGELTAALTSPAGASAVVLGGVVAYATELKGSLLGVDPALLSLHGAVHPEVARALASGVRSELAVAGREADIGVATTGVAGPDPQGGRAVGTVYLGISSARGTRALELSLKGARPEIRAETVRIALAELAAEFCT